MFSHFALLSLQQFSFKLFKLCIFVYIHYTHKMIGTFTMLYEYFTLACPKLFFIYALSILISYINITYTLEVEVSEVLEHTKKQYVYICLLSINVTLKFFQAQIICAIFFYFYI